MDINSNVTKQSIRYGNCVRSLKYRFLKIEASGVDTNSLQQFQDQFVALEQQSNFTGEKLQMKVSFYEHTISSIHPDAVKYKDRQCLSIGEIMICCS